MPGLTGGDGSGLPPPSRYLYENNTSEPKTNNNNSSPRRLKERGSGYSLRG